jgi:hypothetical protein
MKMRILAVLLAMATLVTVVLGVEVGFGDIHHDFSFTAPAPRTFPHNFVGIVSYNVAKFDQTCKCSPNIAVHYLPIGGSTSMGVARSIISTGAIPMLELEPYNISLVKISSGSEDVWLTEYAHAVSSLHSPVIMSFAPEANGNWYSWGYPYTAPQAFVKAWQHVVTVFRKAGVRDVKWAWIMNVQFTKSENIALLWPGKAFVDILGIDGYLITPASFQVYFGPTIVAMRTISSDPLLITETAAAPSVGKATALTEIADGVAQYALVGFIWFDINQQSNTTRQDWRLEDDPAALNLFSSYVKRIR